MVNSVFGPPTLTPTALRLVRYAMLAGLLLFGAIAYSQSLHRTPDPDSLTNLTQLGWVGYGMCALAIVGTAVIRQVRERASEAARPTLSIVGSALAEAAALFGAVYMLLGGSIGIYALGLVLFLATWTLLPADPDAS
jgi:cytochrome c oxidase assembly factor CtaG